MQPTTISSGEMGSLVTPQQEEAFVQIGALLEQIRTICNDNHINFYATAVADCVDGSGGAALQAIDCHLDTDSARVIAACKMGSDNANGPFGQVALDNMHAEIEAGAGELTDAEGNTIDPALIYGSPEGSLQ